MIAGPSAPAGPVAFGSHTFVKPVQLIDGVNNFFASSTATVGEFTLPGPVGVPAEHNWQTATFAGLAPGVYTYQISGMVAVNWSDWNSSTPNWRGTLVIPKSSTQTPEPASLMLLGVGIAGFAAARRRRKNA